MKEKINIALFSDSFYPVIGGRENVIDNLMRQFCNKTNCFLLCPKIGKRYNEKTLPYQVIRSKSFRVSKNEYLSIIDKKTKKQIEQKIKNGEIDIIHTQTKYALAKYALKLGKKYNIPVVTTCHTYYNLIYKTQLKFPPLYKLFIRHAKKTIKKMDCVFTVSEFMKHKLLDMGITKPIIVIPNGNDMLNYQNIAFNKDEFKASIGANAQHILTFVGRINAVKNIELLIDTAKHLKKAGLSFKLLLVGGGELDKYKALAQKNDILDVCVFTGPVKDREHLAKIYAVSSLNLQPSITETFGLTIREAGAMGTPSVVIKDQATSESIEDSQNGFISSPSPKGFAEKIISALTHKDLSKIGKNAKATFALSWNDVSELHIKEYQKLI